jgi:hypothetical protein
MSFSLHEDLATLAATFGHGDYVFSLSETLCSAKDSAGTFAGIAAVAEELRKRGVTPGCIEWTEKQPCLSTEPDKKNRTAQAAGEQDDALNMAIVQRRCEPFSES